MKNLVLLIILMICIFLLVRCGCNEECELRKGELRELGHRIYKNIDCSCCKIKFHGNSMYIDIDEDSFNLANRINKIITAKFKNSLLDLDVNYVEIYRSVTKYDVVSKRTKIDKRHYFKINLD